MHICVDPSINLAFLSNPTRVSLRDPDRVCINSTTMMEGLRVLPQPPWYMGYNNKTVPADTSYMLAANRYGYRGSAAIQQFNVKPYEMPTKTVTTHTPNFLCHNHDFVDEYVPPIVATTQQTVNGLETPKLWPENTTYVEGYKKKERPKSWFYKRETTVDSTERPKSPQSLSTVLEKSREELAILRDHVLMETQRTVLSRSEGALQKFDAAWNDQLLANATSTLKESLREVHPPYEAHTLVDPSDTMRYSGSTAMIIHSQTTEELKFRLRMERSKAKVNTPFDLKWQHIIGHFRKVKYKLKRNQSMTEVVDKIARFWQQYALKGGSETSMRRADFVLACSRISFFEDISSKQISQLYSLFDPDRKNSMRYVEILLMFVVLDRPQDSIFQKVRMLWSYASQFGLDRSLFDVALGAFSAFAGSRKELQTVEELFKSEFRPQCYEYCVTGKVEKINCAELLPSRTATPLGSNSVEDNISPEKERSTVSKMPVSSYVKHQYNICESQLNADSIEEILQACPALLKEMDRQLSERLLACYGKDDRYKEPEQASNAVENLDFSWIMKKEAPKREVFGLY